MGIGIAAYQHGIYPRSEEVVAATRGLERGRTGPEEVSAAYAQDRADFIQVQREAGLDYSSDGLLRWQDVFRPLVDSTSGLDAHTLVRWFDNNSFFRAPEPCNEIHHTLQMLSDSMIRDRAFGSHPGHGLDLGEQLLNRGRAIKRLAAPGPPEIAPVHKLPSVTSKAFQRAIAFDKRLDRSATERAAQTVGHGLQVSLNPSVECTAV